MPEGGFNAGTIYLQVVPVFGDLQNAIGRQAKAANSALKDEMEKGGHDAGKAQADAVAEEMEKGGSKGAEKYHGAFAKEFKNRMRGLSRELEPISVPIEVEDKEVQKTFDEVRARAKAMRNVTIGVDVTSREAAMELAKLEAQLRLLHEQAKDIQVKADLKTARSQVGAFMNEIRKNHPDIPFNMDFKQAERQLSSFEQKFKNTLQGASKGFGDSIHPEIRKIQAELDSLSGARIGVDIDDEAAQASLDYLIGKMKEIDGQKLDINARASVAEAIAKLEILRAVMADIDGDKLKIDVDEADSKRIGDVANNFRALNFVLLAAVSLLPALIPLIGALGGALLALGPAITGVTASFGVMLLGFSGIGAAVKAMGAKEKAGAADSQAAAARIKSASRAVADAEASLAQARISAARSTADAERGLAQARTSAARANADAARNVAQAERTSAQQVKAALQTRTDAQRAAARADEDAAQAQRDLTKARQDAKKELQDTADKLAQNKLDERQGVIDLFNATVANNAAQQDPGSTNLEREQAAINLAQAKLRLKMIREEQKALEQQQKSGIKGTQTVKTAQDALTSALQRQADAHRALGRAAAAVDQARVEGARQVADAVRSQQRTEADGQRSIADAVRTQQRAQEDGQKSIANAQKNLKRAQDDYNVALNQTSTSAKAVEDAMNKLSPAGRHFARFLFGLRKQFYDIRDAAQEGMLGGVERAIDLVMTKDGPLLMKFVRRSSKTIGSLFVALAKVLTGPVFTQFFKMLNRLGPLFTRAFSHVVLDWMQIFARLMTIVAPWAVLFSKAMVRVSDAILGWVKSKEGTKTITDFMKYAVKVGPMVMDFFTALGGALINLMVALAPLGALILKALTGFLKWIAGMKPKNLAIIATIIITLVIAFQAVNTAIYLAALSMSMFELLGAPLMGLLIGIVGGVVLLVGAIVVLYTQSKTFRKIVNGAFHAVGVAAKWLWKNAMKPAMHGIGLAFKGLWIAAKWAWDKVLHPVFTAIGKVATWLWKYIIKPYFKLIYAEWKILATVIKWYWRHFLWPVWDLFGHIVGKVLWDGILKPFFKQVGKNFGDLAHGIKYAWDHWIKPAINAFGDAMTALWRKYIKPAVDKIGDAWDKIRAKLAKPINWVIGTVFNDHLIAGFNKVAKFVGSSPMPKMSLISEKAYAGGGTYGTQPGYTPGRDVHHYVNPRNGAQLHLSGGEPIMRPEFGAVVGRGWVDYMNSVARRHGTRGVKRALSGQAFAKGGFYWPTTGHITSTYPGHDGIDINGPGQDYGNPIFALRKGRITYAGWGHGYGHAIFEKLAGGPTVVYGHGSAVYVHSGQNVRGGQLIGRVGSTGHSTGPHLHFGIPGGTPAQAMALLHGAMDVKGGSSVWDKLKGAAAAIYHLPGKFAHVLAKPFQWAKGLITNPLHHLEDKFGKNPLVRMLSATGHKLLEGVADKAKDLLGHFKDKKDQELQATDALPSMIGSAVGAVVKGTVVAQVKAVAKRYGWASGAEWSALSHIIDAESGWNPKAANPTSSARGLFQKMTSLHGPVEKTPYGQALWGLNYIKKAYGDPENAWRFHRIHNWYKDGGVYGEENGFDAIRDTTAKTAGVADNGTMMYDSGGYLPPGVTTVLNLTRKPEPVLTHDQFRDYSGGAGGTEVWHYEPHFEGSSLTAQDVAYDLDHTIRTRRNQGKYRRR